MTSSRSKNPEVTQRGVVREAQPSSPHTAHIPIVFALLLVLARTHDNHPSHDDAPLSRFIALSGHASLLGAPDRKRMRFGVEHPFVESQQRVVVREQEVKVLERLAQEERLHFIERIRSLRVHDVLDWRVTSGINLNIKRRNNSLTVVISSRAWGDLLLLKGSASSNGKVKFYENRLWQLKSVFTVRHVAKLRDQWSLECRAISRIWQQKNRIQKHKTCTSVPAECSDLNLK